MELAKERRGHILYRLFCPKGVLTFVFYLYVACIGNTFRTVLETLLLLVFKIVESLQFILNRSNAANGTNQILDLEKLRVCSFLRLISVSLNGYVNTVCNCHNPEGLKFITRLRLGLSHLREHKFKHSFQDMINPLCGCDFHIP